MRHLRDIRRGVTDGWTDGRTDGRTDRRTDGHDLHIYATSRRIKTKPDSAPNRIKLPKLTLKVAFRLWTLIRVMSDILIKLLGYVIHYFLNQGVIIPFLRNL